MLLIPYNFSPARFLTLYTKSTVEVLAWMWTLCAVVICCLYTVFMYVFLHNSHIRCLLISVFVVLAQRCVFSMRILLSIVHGTVCQHWKLLFFLLKNANPNLYFEQKQHSQMKVFNLCQSTGNINIL